MSEHLPPSKALVKKVAELVAANDMDALVSLRGDYVVKQEAARMRFARSRDIKAGQTYRRVGLELSEIKNAIRQLEMKDGVTEAVLEAAIGDAVKGGIRNVADRILYGLGSHTARGRLDLNAATKHLFNDWKGYAGRHAAAGEPNILKAPTLGQLIEFLKFQYGVEVTEDELAKISRSNAEEAAPKSADDHARETLKKLKATNPAEYQALRKKMMGANESVIVEDSVLDQTFNPKALFPKLANFLIQQGVITVARYGGKTAGSVETKQTRRMDDKEIDQQPVKKNPKAAKKKEKEPEAEEPTDADKEAATTTAMTDDGHFIDAKKFGRLLDAGGVHRDQMDDLRTILDLPDITIANRLRRNDALATALSTLVGAALDSISNKNTNVKIDPINVTDSGNTVNLNTMKERLKKEGVRGSDLSRLRDAVKDGNFREVIQNRGELAKTTIGVAQAVIHSIQNARGAAKRGA